MIKNIICASLIYFMGAFSVWGQSADDILGKWLTMGEKSHIEIFKPAGKDVYFGKIIWLKDPLDENGQPKKDTNGNQVLNMMNLKDFKFDSGEWVDGTIYDPESCKTYHCSMKLVGNNVLQVRGSLDSWGWIGRTDTWNRVK